MVYNPREGIRAKQVLCHFVDNAYNASNSSSLTHTGFTGNEFANFWGAYYGDAMTLNSVDYSMKNLGFPSGAAGANVTEAFDGAAFDSVASVTTTVITLTTNTGMTINEHVGKYVTIKPASSNSNLVYGRIVSNTDSSLTMDQDLTLYGVAASDTIILLKVPFGLTMTAFHRVDHIATDFTLTPPTTETEDNYFLGTEDDAGSQNSNVDSQPPTKMTGSITIRGGTQDLLRLKYGQDSVTPAGTKRYNLGSEITTKVAFHAFWSTSKSDVDAASAISKGVFCNDVIITNVGILDSVSSDARGEATVEFEVKGSNVRVEGYNTQADNAAVNQ